MDFENNRYVDRIFWRTEPGEGSYLHQLAVVKALKKLGELHLTKPVTFLVGENGCGKSTLLEAVAVASGFNPEGGTRNFCFSTSDTHSELYRCIGISRHNHPKDGFFLRAESFYNVATEVDELSKVDGRMLYCYGGKSLHEQSHGESFLAVVMNRFGGNGLYVLDEPEAALSPMRQLSLLAAIHALVKKNSQFIISTHSPILMALPGSAILELSDAGIRETAYRDTAHYQFTRRFLENPERMLRYLLEDD